MKRLKFQATQKKIAASALCTLAALVSGCAKETEDSTSKATAFTMPNAQEIVNESLPEGLKPSSSAARAARSARAQRVGGGRSSAVFSTSNAIDGIKNIFLGSYGKMSGGQAQGYINAYLEDMQSRVDEVVTRAASGKVACMEAAAQDYTLDISSLHAALTLPLKVNCIDEFTWNEGDPGAPGAGLVFGKTATEASMWLRLMHEADTDTTVGKGFAYAARITGLDQAEGEQEVTMLMAQRKSGESAGEVFKLRAVPASNTFELLYAASSPSMLQPVVAATGVSDTATNLGCFFRMISDGTYIHVAGLYAVGGTCGQVADDFDDNKKFDTYTNSSFVDLCLNAADLSQATPLNCTSLSASYQLAESSYTGTGVGSLDDFAFPIIKTDSEWETAFGAFKLMGETAIKEVTAAFSVDTGTATSSTSNARVSRKK